MSQTPNRIIWVIWIWSLELIWILEFVIWNLFLFRLEEETWLKPR